MSSQPASSISRRQSCCTAIDPGDHGAGQFYTHGLDLDWLTAHGDQTQVYVGRMQALLARVLTLPVPTAAGSPGMPSAPVQCWRWLTMCG